MMIEHIFTSTARFFLHLYISINIFIFLPEFSYCLCSVCDFRSNSFVNQFIQKYSCFFLCAAAKINE